jgi:hypothetical protein
MVKESKLALGTVVNWHSFVNTNGQIDRLSAYIGKGVFVLFVYRFVIHYIREIDYSNFIQIYTSITL